MSVTWYDWYISEFTKFMYWITFHSFIKFHVTDFLLLVYAWIIHRFWTSSGECRSATKPWLLQALQLTVSNSCWYKRWICCNLRDKPVIYSYSLRHNIFLVLLSANLKICINRKYVPKCLKCRISLLKMLMEEAQINSHEFWRPSSLWQKNTLRWKQKFIHIA
jgi:hypothetical protein